MTINQGLIDSATSHSNELTRLQRALAAMDERLLNLEKRITQLEKGKK